MRVGVKKRREERAEGRETRVPDVRSGALHASAAARPRAYETPGDPQNRKPRIGREGGEDTRPTGRWAPGGVPTSSAMHTALGQTLAGPVPIQDGRNKPASAGLSRITSSSLLPRTASLPLPPQPTRPPVCSDGRALVPPQLSLAMHEPQVQLELRRRAAQRQHEMVLEVSRKNQASEPRKREAPCGSSGHVPYRAFMGLPEASQAPSGGRALMLLAPPMQPPDGYIPKVHSTKGDSKETSERALEATRLVPAISKENWEQILDEPWDTLAS